MNPKVDAYLERVGKWQAEVTALRNICLETHLEEELKWGQPCYTLNGKNIVLIGGDFKDYCVLLFMQGALIPDAENLLVTPGGHQAARQLRFTTTAEIKSKKKTILQYIAAAVEIQQSGKKAPKKAHEAYMPPDELKEKIATDRTFKKAWEALTPGRQRGYILHIGSAKQSKTREARIEKCFPTILEGKGWNEL